MLRFATVLFLLLTTPLPGAVLIKGQRVDLSRVQRTWLTPISLEHATSRSDLQWGLMRRQSMPANHGMTFSFPKSQKLSFWMFNCFMDLSVAFLDSNRVIRDIHPLKAFPERMDPDRPVKTLSDLKKYAPDDPIVAYFQETAAHSAYPAKYALEMNAGWFQAHDVKAGDVAAWHKGARIGAIIHTLSLSNYSPTEEMPVVLVLPGDCPIAVWNPESEDNYDIAFLDDQLVVRSKAKLAGGQTPPTTAREKPNKDVACSQIPVKYCIVATEGWLARNLLKGGVTVDGEMLLRVSPRRGGIAQQ